MSTGGTDLGSEHKVFPMPAEAEDIYRRYRPQVYKFLFRMSGDHYLADELTQETFLRAFAALPGFRGDALFSTWLYRIARNLFLTHCRRERRTLVEPAELVTSFLPGTPAAELPEEHALHSEQQELVQLALERMDERERTFIVLREISDLTYAEIAEIMGISLGAVKIGLHRARERFREVYRECLAGHERGRPGAAPARGRQEPVPSASHTRSAVGRVGQAPPTVSGHTASRGRRVAPEVMARG